MKDQFSFSRVHLLLKRDIINNWKRDFYAVVALTACFLFVTLIYMWIVSPSDFGIVSSVSAVNSFIVGTCKVICSVFLPYYGSLLFSGYKHKQGRISEMMIPARRDEKFLSVLLHILFGGFLIVLLSALCADLLHLLFVPLYQLPNEYYFPVLWGALSDGWNQLLSENGLNFLNYVIFLFLTVMWLQSVFIIGAAVWRRHPFMKVVGVWMALSVAVMLVSLVPWGIFHKLGELLQIFDSANFNVWSIICIQLLLILLNYYIAYRCFLRIQVIPKRRRLL